MRSIAFVVALVSLSTTARADEICFEQQVCEEVCTDVVYEVDEATLDTSYRSTGGGRGVSDYQLPQSCETVCTFEEYCYPVDTTNGGEGNTYDTDDIDACYAEQLLVDQIRCIAMLGA